MAPQRPDIVNCAIIIFYVINEKWIELNIKFQSNEWMQPMSQYKHYLMMITAMINIIESIDMHVSSLMTSRLLICTKFTQKIIANIKIK